VATLIVALSIAAACGGATTAPDKKKAAPKPTVDVCEGSKPPWREYDGPLAGSRCEQEQFSRMATIAQHLNVECGYCHVPKEGTKSFEYPAMTEKKLAALWMHKTFFAGLKRADGKEMECRHCHLDKNRKPAAKFLGTPRDIGWSVEWMTTTMTNDFVHKDGSKVKCKDCHQAAWGMPGFQQKVIGKDLPFVPHAAPLPSASASAAPSAEPAPSASAPSAPAPPAPSASAPPAKP
jgi:hypothetical protein